MPMDKWLFLFFGLLLLCFDSIAKASSECEPYTTCESCTTSGKSCIWITDQDCNQKCADMPSSDTPISMLWRRNATVDSSYCPSHLSCTLKSDSEIDGTFKDGKWTSVGYSNAKNIIIDRAETLRRSKNIIDVPYGENIAFFGALNEIFSQELYLKIKIPDDATHLSFLLLASFDASSRTVFTVFVDDDFLVYIDSNRANPYLSRYRNLDVNIKKYSGKKHTIRFLFYGTSSSDFALVDYVTFIRDTSTGDSNWHPEPQWPAVVDECAPGCPRKNINDERCDPLCNNVMCQFDNGACQGNKYIIQRAHDTDNTADICY